jgi:hypothetical protein
MEKIDSVPSRQYINITFYERNMNFDALFSDQDWSHGLVLRKVGPGSEVRKLPHCRMNPLWNSGYTPS